MRSTMRLFASLALALPAALAGCNRAEEGSGSAQTGLPGHVTAGGGTSGEVMARTAGSPAQTSETSGTPGIPKGSGGNTGGTAVLNAPAGGGAGQEGVRGQSAAGTGSSGTPGIPEGAGGNPSGAAMGGTTEGAAASQAAPPPGESTPSVPAQQEKR